MFFKHWYTDDTEVGVVIAKARFERATDGMFYASQTPPEFQLEDTYEGDPVAAATGVFAHLEADQVSDAEAARLGTVETGADSPPTGKPEREWTPRLILRRITEIYKKLGKPTNKNKGAE